MRPHRSAGFLVHRLCRGGCHGCLKVVGESFDGFAHWTPRTVFQHGCSVVQGDHHVTVSGNAQRYRHLQDLADVSLGETDIRFVAVDDDLSFGDWVAQRVERIEGDTQALERSQIGCCDQQMQIRKVECS